MNSNLCLQYPISVTYDFQYFQQNITLRALIKKSVYSLPHIMSLMFYINIAIAKIFIEYIEADNRSAYLQLRF